ncbi:hypothetical protein [Carnimonas nigrificans]|uniref:hypothetical protein n=1 Tax=Carnimonas nigrificans TaxID=64323 RepID=UPI0004AF6606|nr:hypothetical protein [Carnimonas nigrificans]
MATSCDESCDESKNGGYFSMSGALRIALLSGWADSRSGRVALMAERLGDAL